MAHQDAADQDGDQLAGLEDHLSRVVQVLEAGVAEAHRDQGHCNH